MAALMEVLLTTDASGLLWNACVWDFHTGTALKVYKGGCSSPRSVSFLNNEFLISAAEGKPIIHVWTIQEKGQQQQQQHRIVCAGVVSCLASSKDGTFCAAGIAEKIHLWQVCNGDLLAVLSRHYQKVTCLTFTDDGSYLLTGGEDNLVIVWSMSSILQQNQASKSCEPLYVWSMHALPIVDIWCGVGGLRSRVVSGSHDQTCKLWDLSSGQLLCNFVFDAPVCSVTMDNAEYHLFVGCMNGNIYQVDLFACSAQKERHITDSNDYEDGDSESAVFKGHSKPVTCLSVSMDGTLLVSGSQDHTACIWHVESKQRIRTLNHKGAVSNVAFMAPLANMFGSRKRMPNKLQPFKRRLLSEMDGSSDVTGDTVAVRIPDRDVSAGSDDIEALKAAFQQAGNTTKTPSDTLSHLSRQELEEELLELRKCNQVLYQSVVAVADR